MSKKTYRMVVDFTYEPKYLHENSEEGIRWFESILMGGGLMLYGPINFCEGSNVEAEMGDIKVVELQEISGDPT